MFFHLFSGALGLFATAFWIWMAVEVVRRGHVNPWLWVVLIFGPVGGAVYFFAVILGDSKLVASVGRPKEGPRLRLPQAEIEVRRLDNASAWRDYAESLRFANRLPEAVGAARNAVAKEPKDPHINYELGRCLVLAGQGSEAGRYLEVTLANDRGFDSGEALFLLAEARSAQGDEAGALTLRRELAGRSSQPRYLFALAEAERRAGDINGARTALERIVREGELVPPYLRGQVGPWIRKARKALAQLG